MNKSESHYRSERKQVTASLRYQVSDIEYRISSFGYQVTGLKYRVVSTRMHGESRECKLLLFETLWIMNQSHDFAPKKINEWDSTCRLGSSRS